MPERRARRGALAEAKFARGEMAVAAARRDRRLGSGGPFRLGPQVAVGGAVALVVVAAGFGVYVARHRDGASSPVMVTADEVSCGGSRAWPAAPAAGQQDFVVADHADNPVAVYLINPVSNAVFAEFENLGPHTSRPMAVALGSGTYAFRCVFSDGTVLDSRAYTIPGEVRGPAGLIPVSAAALSDAVYQYRAFVWRNLNGLLADSVRLDADLHAGGLAAARRDWLPAHLDYERLGAAYRAFGQFDTEINGLAGGLPGTVANPGWTGFHRIEYGLWHGGATADLAPSGDRLVSDITSLIQAMRFRVIQGADLPLRAHEILEDALRYQLTGIADYGSDTMLATVSANVAGTEEVLAALRPLLSAADPAAPALILARLAAVRADLQPARLPGGSWIPVGQLSTAARCRLDADLGAALEQLAVVSGVLAERNGA